MNPETSPFDAFVVESNRNKNEDVFIDNYIGRRRVSWLSRPGAQSAKGKSLSGKADCQKALVSWQSAR